MIKELLKGGSMKELSTVSNISKNSNTHIRAASFNIGDFTTATESAGNDIRYGSGTKKTLAEYTEVFKELDADVWGLQEDSEFFFYPEKIYPYDALYKSILPYHHRVFTQAYNGKAFLSRYELFDLSTVSYPATTTSYAPQGTSNYGHPWFLTGKIALGGKEISLVCLHFDWHCKQRRAAQIKEVVKFAKTQEYCIILGDFNPENLVNGERQNDGESVDPDTVNMYKSDWKKFTDAGLECANGGAYGTYGTIMSNGSPASPHPWDNIVVTPNIKILNAGAIYKSWMNDHAIIFADLEIL